MRTTKLSNNFFKNVYLIFTLVLLIGGCTNTPADDSSVSKYGQLSSPLTLGQLTKIYGVGSQGHGPYIWYVLPRKKQELWAWFMPVENKQLDDFQVIFLTEVEIDNPENVNIVWPEQYVGQPLEQVYNKAYRLIRSKGPGSN